MIHRLFNIGLLLLLAVASQAQEFHTLDSTVPVAGAADKHVTLERAFPRLRFARPVYLTGSGDGSGRLFVTEQNGVVRSFVAKDETTESTVFLDIRDRISRRGNEEGLIGLAFHPQFKKNGEVFIHYSSRVKDMHGVLSRFRLMKDDSDRLDPASEEVILELKQPYRNHNGGMIEFGPDGYLYITFGDGGAANDPHLNGQNIGTWLGSILRIDVDQKDDGHAYAVPKDNPFVNVDGARPETWAFGLRNVWRFSFDRKTGALWAADVGQNKWEEVDVIVKGGNYGWNRYESHADFRRNTELGPGKHIAPVAEYAREWGISITGGYVYRGKKHRALQGFYFYGDYATGNLWRHRAGKKGKGKSELVRRTGRSIASFGEDDDGELFVLSFDGGIYRVVPTNEPEATLKSWATTLAETDWYTSGRRGPEPSDTLLKYELNAPFWSDGAEKTRFISLPAGKKIVYRDEGTWELPVGAAIIKHFDMRGRRGNQPVETRVIRRTRTGWEAATYVYEGGRKRKATLRPEGRQVELYTRAGVKSWHAPSSSECGRCHVDAAGYVLGLTTAQLNRDVDGSNQIDDWAARGLLKMPRKSKTAQPAARFVSPKDESASLEDRARVWLDVNCAMCHRPDGPGNAAIDLRYGTALDKTGMVGVKPAQGGLGIENPHLIAPGSPESSMVLHRVATLGDGRMPNLGTNVVDTEGVELLKSWIAGMK